MTTTRYFPPLIALLAIVAACTGAAPSPPPTTTPTAAPSAAITHGTGATDVILRFEQDGGFVAPGVIVTRAPIFTLYGDGTVIFRDPTRDPSPAVGRVSPLRPFRTTRLSETQVQALLAGAIDEGRLGTARASYLDEHIADAPTAVFTLHAGGLDKAVSIYALGIDVDGASDASDRAAFVALAEDLSSFDRSSSVATTPYEPTRYRGVLQEGQPGDPAAVPWPWTDLKPTDFAPPTGPDRIQIPIHTLTATQAAATGITSPQGGFGGLALTGPDGMTYTFSVRPLLPDEAN